MKKQYFAAFALAAAIPTPALADFSVGVRLGSANQTTSASSLPDISGSDTSFGIGAAFKFHKNFAVEANYNDFGQMEDSYIDSFDDLITDKVSSNSLSIGLKTIFPVGETSSLFLRAGLSSWDWEIEETDSAFPGFVFKADDSGTDIHYGVGFNQKLGDLISIGIDYTITPMGASVNGFDIDNDVKNLSLSLDFTF